MIKVKCEQGSPEWFAARAGVASTSNFDRIITASGRPSSQQDDYIYELAAEFVTGEKKSIKPSYWMERGTNMEPQAKARFMLEKDKKVEEVGFIYKDKKKLVGCSPDGLVDSDGLEIKCPAPITHVSYLLQDGCPKQYLPQVQGSMWITGLHHWWFVSFHPDYPVKIEYVERDKEWMAKLDEIMPAFLDRLANMRKDPRVKELLAMRVAQQEAAA